MGGWKLIRRKIGKEQGNSLDEYATSLQTLEKKSFFNHMDYLQYFLPVPGIMGEFGYSKTAMGGIMTALATSEPG